MEGKDNNTTANKSTLSYRVIRKPTKGNLTWTSDGKFTYWHSGSSLGYDSFDFVVNNGYLDSNAATITLDIQLPVLEYQDMKDHWGRTSAGSLGGMRIVVGDRIQSLYYYRPNDMMTRAEFIMFLNAIMEYPISERTSSVFQDVKDAHMVRPLNTAYEHGVTSGTSYNGRLYIYPNKVVTRIEAMHLLNNAMRFNPQNYTATALEFADRSSIPVWAEQSVRNLIGYKIIVGHNGMLRPTGLLTRAEGAELLYKAYMERKGK
jgi:hypothetical protein